MSDQHVSAGRWLVIAVLVILSILSILVGVTLMLTSSGAASSQDVESQGKRRDCVTTLSTARRAVFDDVDIYKAILIKAGTDKSLGLPLDGGLAYYQAVDTNLGKALIEAARLRPAKVLDRLIAHGGMIDGVHYDPCPG